jgi:endonuclease-3 related protein
LTAARLQELHRRLAAHYGPQRWWPAESAFEVAVGAVLTQNTAWRNVEAAMANLKQAGALSLGGLLALAPEELAGLIRPAGYYRLKERRLRNLLEMLAACGGLPGLAELPLDEARQRLLAVNGVGPETADSILLYALDRPAFVVDAYTGRILARHGLAREKAAYHELQELFTAALPADPALYNELHALLVRLGAGRCRRSRPRCEGCPLEGWPE